MKPAVRSVLIMLLMLLTAATGGVGETFLINGEAGESVIISNPPGDWLSPARARCVMEAFAGGADSGSPGDRSGYRLFSGSQAERDDNQLLVPLEISPGTNNLKVGIGVLAVSDTALPLSVYFDERKVGILDLAGEANELLEREARITVTAEEKKRLFHLIRIVDDEKMEVEAESAETVLKSTERPTFLDWVMIEGDGVRSAWSMHVVADGDHRFVLRKSWKADGSFRLFQVGRYLGSCIERRSYDREVFRKQRIRFPKNGYRQVGHTNDTWHTIFTVKRDAEGRQIENWAEMPRDWFGDHEASSQERGFRIVFDSPGAGRATLRMHRVGGGIDCSMVVVVNGDVARARVGQGLATALGPGGHTVNEGAAASRLFDVKAGEVTELQDVPVRRGRNMIDFDYAGIGFLWPAQTFPSLAEGFDYLACDLIPDEPLAEGEDVAFRELPLSGERHSQAVTAEVDFNTRWTLNGQSEIPPTLFGVTTYNAGAGMTTRESFDEVKQLGVGMLYGGLHYGVSFPPPVDSEGQPADYEAIWHDYEEKFASEARGRWSRPPLQMAARVGIPYVVHLDIGGWGVQAGTLVKGVPADVDDYTNKLVRLVRVIKKHAPELEFVFLGGETEGNLCESALLRPPGHDDRTGAELYGIVTRVFGQKVHQEFPDIKILGPENWGPPLGGPDAVDLVGHRFDDWVRPYLEEAWPALHGFGYHCYWGDYTREQTGELQTLANFMLARFGTQKPMYMTEGHLSGFEWSGSKTKYDDRALWLYDGYHVLRTLCYSVENCDKLKALLWHDLCGWDAEEWATYRSRAVGLPPPSDLPSGSLDMTTFMPIYGALWLFRDLRGDLVKATFPGEPETAGLRVLASHKGRKGSCIILNGSLDPRPITIKLNPPAGVQITKVEVECLEARDNYYNIMAQRLPADRWQREGNTVTIQALPLAGYHVQVTFDGRVRPRKKAGRVDYYGDKVMVGINRYVPKGRIKITCPPQGTRARRAHLKIAYESLLLEPEEVIWAFNGQRLTVDRRDYIQIPLTPRTLRRENVLSFRLKDPQTRNDLRVRSAVVAVEYTM